MLKQTSPGISRIPQQNVFNKIKYYEQLFSTPDTTINNKRISQQYTLKQNNNNNITINNKENINKNTNIISSPSSPHSINKQQSNIKNNSPIIPSLQSYNKPLIKNEKIHVRSHKYYEKELPSNIYKEKPVEYIKEEKEERKQKIEILEKKVQKVRKQHRDSLRQGNTIQANNLLKKLHQYQSKLALENTISKKESLCISTDEKCEDIDNYSEKSNSCSSFIEYSESSIHIDENNINGDLWGGIVDVMANECCSKDEKNWRKFSSYSVCNNDIYTELTLNKSNSDDISISNNISLYDIHQDEIEDPFETEKRNRSIFDMYDRLEDELVISNRKLDVTKTELAKYRAKLYSALHLLAKNEYQVRLYEDKLLGTTGNYLEMEKTIEEQKIKIAQQENKVLQQEIELLKKEALIRKQQVSELRNKIRESISSLPLHEQTTLRNQLAVEDPFIECSINLLESTHTPLQRLSILEKRLSILSSREDIRITKKKSSIPMRKKHKRRNLYNGGKLTPKIKNTFTSKFKSSTRKPHFFQRLSKRI